MVDTTVEHHLGQYRQVGGGGEQPGMTGHTPQAPGVLIVDVAANQQVAVQLAVFGGHYAGQPFAGGIEIGGVHSQRLKYNAIQVNVQRQPGEPFDNLPQGDKTDIGVDGCSPRHGVQGGGINAIQPAGDCALHQEKLPEGGQSGAVGQQVADGHLGF